MSALNVRELLLAQHLDREQVAALLGPYGLRDLRRADANLQTTAGDPSERQLFAEILEDLLLSASRSADPDQALNYFERFARAALNKTQLFSYLKGSAPALETLVKSLGGSPYMAEILIRDPQHFYWVTDPQTLQKPRTKRAIQADLVRTLKVVGDERKQLDYLRFLKRREMLHIGVRDILRLSTVEETCTALSTLAEALIAAAYWICASALRREYQIPATAFTRFTILAMGKLGGSELNFSSDVDLMYLYESGQERVGAISAPDYFRRLSHKITAGLNKFTGEGYVYRVDLRLRPDGEAGEIACSLDAFERYYKSRMGTWERLALLKAWPVAGNRALGRDFLNMATPFIYGPPFDLKAQDEVLLMKRRVERKTAGGRLGGRNVKLGIGGIREIELIVQSFQVRYGGSLSHLRGRNTLKTLAALGAAALLSAEEVETLGRAYVFLRDVENKLQMTNDAQTHSLPVGQEELTACARLLGYAGTAEFEQAYEHHTGPVNRIFEAIVGDPRGERFR
jgi:glutamate-ammonia-ligase adenylyltransferase